MEPSGFLTGKELTGGGSDLVVEGAREAVSFGFDDFVSFFGSGVGSFCFWSSFDVGVVSSFFSGGTSTERPTANPNESLPSRFRLPAFINPSLEKLAELLNAFTIALLPLITFPFGSAPNFSPTTVIPLATVAGTAVNPIATMPPDA